ncbi:MAG: hypothetical protein AAGK92_07750 [Pseudomonadota bacterium]
MSDVLHRCPASLADELGAIRAHVKALKAREQAVRQALLAARPNGRVTGMRYAVRVVNSTSRRFDRAALPDAILQDPRYWREVCSLTVTAQPLDEVDGPEANPDHILRATASAPEMQMLPGLDAPEERFDVIEPF